MKETNKIRCFIVFVFLFLLISCFGATYAYWQITNKQNNFNTLGSKCFEVTMANESAAINLENAYPITDEEGLSLEGYSFTIKNTCNTIAAYEVNLEEMLLTNIKRLDNSYVKVSINDGTPKNIDALTKKEPSIEGSDSSYELTRGSLKPDEEVNYTVKLWMDNDTPALEETMNATFESKISISAGYIENTENEISLSYESQTTVVNNVQEEIIVKGESKNYILIEYSLDSSHWTRIENPSKEVSIPYTFKEEGTYTFYVKDEMGNINSLNFETSKLDQTAPEVEIQNTSFALGQENYLSFHISDQKSNVSYAITTDNAEPTTWINTLQKDFEYNEKVTDLSVKYLWVKDELGNISSAKEIPSILINLNITNEYANYTVTVDGVNNATSYVYYLDNQELENTSTASYTIEDMPTGLHEFKVVINDTLGNTVEVKKEINVESVARIEDITYASLQAAFNAVKENTETEVILLKDITEQVVIAQNKKVILTTNGKKINAEATALTNYGILTTDANIISDTSQALNNYGTANITGGTFISNGGNTINNSENATLMLSSNVILENHSQKTENNTIYPALVNYGTTTIEGGTYSSDVSDVLWNRENATLTINKGSFTALDNNILKNEGTTYINGGDFSTNDTSTLYNDTTGNLNVANGTFTSAETLALNNHGVSNITGGTFTSNGLNTISNSENATLMLSSNVILENHSQRTENNTTYPTIVNYGTTTIEGGTYSSDVSRVLWNRENATLTINKGSFTALERNILDNEGTTYINGGDFSTNDASTLYNDTTGNLNVTNGTFTSAETLVLNNFGVSNITGGTFISNGANTISNSENATLTLSSNIILENHSQTAENNTTYPALVNYGTTTIEGGTYSSDVSRVLWNRENATLTINKGSFTALDNNILNNEGTTYINGGDFSTNNTSTLYNDTTGVLNVTNGTVTSAETIALNNYGVSNITGGTFISNGGNTINNRENAKLTIDGTAIIQNTIESYPTLYNYGTVEIKNGTISAENTNAIYNRSEGNLTVLNGTISSTNSIALNNYGTANITGGTVTSNVENVIYNRADATLTINGTPSISTTGTSGSTIYNVGEANINGGDFSTNDSVTLYNDTTGNLNVTNGTFTSAETLVLNNYGVSNITGGTFISNGANTINNRENATLMLSSNVIFENHSQKTENNTSYPALVNYGTTTIEGGTYSSDVSNVLWNRENATLTINKGSFTALDNNILDNEGTTYINGGDFSTNDTSTLYNNTTGNLNVANGMFTSAETLALNNYGTANITGGTFTSNGANTIYNRTDAVMNVSGGRIIALDYRAIYNYGNLTLSDNAYLENNSTTKSTIYNTSSATYTNNSTTVTITNLGGGPTIN